MADPTALDVDDFATWFDELWHVAPFPWQVDLVHQVHRAHQWPQLVDLPTGTGKTSLIDIAVFLQALDADVDPGDRWMPRRIVSVVDRRVVVDQTARRAYTIAKAVQATSTPAMSAVATRLRRLAGTEEDDTDPPLLVATLRGAIAKDESWMRRPDVPAVLSSTIDQAGSRLLFRGYGISRGMRPIHAGLLGNDTLWLLDEVHLARPFAQTLDRIGSLRQRRTAGRDLPDRWAVVEMTATPTDPSATPTRFPATPLDPDQHPVIGRRLKASKPAELDVIKVAADPTKADAAFATACAARARRLIDGGTRTVGVIVNRVDTARRVHTELGQAGVTSHLLTGRMRPIDRDRALDELEPRIGTARSRTAADEPLVVVATQCIEAGADFDLDAIVTEAASLDALTQRFGRVDRDGQLSAAGQQQTSVILARSTDLKDGADDPVYGARLRETWEWLSERTAVDFGITRLLDADEQPPPDLARAASSAPILLPTHLDQLAQTSDPISGDPDIARWLHGDAPTAPEVQIVWRADVDELLIRTAASPGDVGRAARDALSERLGACPPASTEAVSVSIRAARLWLQGHGSPVTDAEGVDIADQAEARPESTRPWITWRRGTATAQIVGAGERPRPAQLRPGDVIVVPASYGGLLGGTWDPAATAPVDDVASVALHRRGRVDVLRLIPELTPLRSDADVSWPTADRIDHANPSAQRDLARSLLEAIDVDALGRDDHEREAMTAVIKRLRSRRGPTLLHVEGRRWSGPDGPETRSLIIWRRAEKTAETSILSGAPADTDATEEASSFTASHATLADHLMGVGSWGGLLSERLGLPPETTADVACAGRLHDEGKRDRRFQILLHGGDRLAAAAHADEPLAKSARPQPSIARRQRIRKESGYPKGARHELTSLALLTADDLGAATDPDLVAHLVASHHGWCRPFSPAVIDDDPIAIERDGAVTPSDHRFQQIDSPATARFWQVNERYGWFHLAWLEAVLRLADHRQSEQEQLKSEKEAV